MINYTIGTLSELSGLSQHTIRAWERRYNALIPIRSETNRRVYRPEDLERLVLLRDGIHNGHSIGHIANLSTEQLRALQTPMSHQSTSVAMTKPLPDDPAAYLLSCQKALEQLDADALDSNLSRAQATFGVVETINRVILPFIRIIDNGWMEGSIGISHEHMASAVLRSQLIQIRRMMPTSSDSPKLLIATPSNQQHELGALLVAIVAATQGWSSIYLGINIPAKDVANAAIQSKAQAVALSLVYEGDEPTVRHDITELRHRLPATIPIFAGGRAAGSYAHILHQFGVVILTDIWSLRTPLNELA